jgi:hypothetical protein
MNEIINPSVESLIVKLLKDGPLSAVMIIDKLQRTRAYTPKQTVYLALRKLKKKEVIAISGKIVSLNLVWVAKMKNFFTEVDSHYTNSKEASLFDLQEKEYIIYKFDSLLSLDIYWSHAFMLFMGAASLSSSILLYSPIWPFIIREEIELDIMREAKKMRINWIHLIAGSKPHNYEKEKYYDGHHTICHFLDEDIFANNYYLNCFSDYIIEVWIDKRAAEEIANIYKSYKIIDNRLIEHLQKILEMKNYKHKLKISKNSLKVMRIKKLFKKYFYIPTEG